MGLFEDISYHEALPIRSISSIQLVVGLWASIRVAIVAVQVGPTGPDRHLC
jgi:hypothetical protein